MTFCFRTASRLLICLFLIVEVTLVIDQQVTAQVVEIPDTNLRDAIRQQLNLSDDTLITQVEMLSLVELEIWRKSPVPIEEQITDLTGLQYAINLRSLVLPRNNISDLNPLQI